MFCVTVAALIDECMRPLVIDTFTMSLVKVYLHTALLCLSVMDQVSMP